MTQSISLPNLGYLEPNTTPPKDEPYQEFMLESMLSNYKTMTQWENESEENTACPMLPAKGYYESLINELTHNFATFFRPQKQ